MGLLNGSRSSVLVRSPAAGASFVQAKSECKMELACEGDLVPAGPRRGERSASAASRGF